KIAADTAEVADHHSHVADRHQGFGDYFHGGEPAVDEISPVREWHVLPAPAAARCQEGLGILVIIVVVWFAPVVADSRGDDLAGRQRRPVVDRDDADAVHHHLPVGIERIARLDRRPDDHGTEAVHLAQFFLPGHDGFELFLTAEVEAVDDIF